MQLSTKKKTKQRLNVKFLIPVLFVVAFAYLSFITNFVRSAPSSVLRPAVPAESATPRKATSTKDVVVAVEPTDFIYRNEWTAPIVMESHKLIFFDVAKAGSTNWKKIFRRMMGRVDWHDADPHPIETNGLRFLNQYNASRATEFMNSLEFTRAMFVRDPKDRILSAFLNKIINDWDVYGKQRGENCCSKNKECVERFQTFRGFLNIVAKCENRECCENSHWISQSRRVDAKFHSKLNFIGRLETAHADARRFLEKIGAWNEYGQSGWGKYGNESFMESKSEGHATNAESRKAEHYTPEIERMVEGMYASDYSLFHLPANNVAYQ